MARRKAQGASGKQEVARAWTRTTSTRLRPPGRGGRRQGGGQWAGPASWAGQASGPGGSFSLSFFYFYFSFVL